jgi:hypothetical protein
VRSLEARNKSAPDNWEDAKSWLYLIKAKNVKKKAGDVR